MPHSTTVTAAGDFDENDIEVIADSTQSFEEQVNEAAATMVEGEDGIWVLPKDSDLSEEVAYAAKLEKRRRDTQSAAAKTSQKLSATKDRVGKLESKLKEVFVPTLTADQQEELADLKTTDPEAWRSKMDEYETAASDAFEEELAGMGYDDDQISEMADRSSQLATFLDENSGLVLNDEVFENDLPPRLTKQLEEGKLSFKEFLVEAKKVLTQTTKIADSNVSDENEPNLNKAGGGSEADKGAVAKDSEQSYQNEIY